LPLHADGKGSLSHTVNEAHKCFQSQPLRREEIIQWLP
jgi:hypothetical protein